MDEQALEFPQAEQRTLPEEHRSAHLVAQLAKFAVHGTEDTLSDEEMAFGYEQLVRVEETWRTMKSGLRLRSVFHGAPHRINAHVTISVFALLLEWIAEDAFGDTWRNIRAMLWHGDHPIAERVAIQLQAAAVGW